MKVILTAIFSLLFMRVVCAQTITVVEQGKPCSIRGLSVVDDHTAWVSGSKGHVGLSVNSGLNWQWQQVKGFEESDFRDIEAFSDKEAIVMSSGTPALILKTVDGGISWKVCYRNDDKAYFLDAMDFKTNGKEGYIMGDPINGKFLLLHTADGGNTWQPVINAPDALPGEAAFAASGTCMIIDSDSRLHMVTGGSTSRLLTAFITTPSRISWQAEKLPLVHGQASQGAFSIATINRGFKVIVGGDYQVPKRTDSVACTAAILDDIPFSVKLANQPSTGYQSCVALIAPRLFLSTGTSGSNISTDTGQNWKAIDAVSYNVCQKARHGNLVLLAGDKGKIAVFENQ